MQRKLLLPITSSQAAKTSRVSRGSRTACQRTELLPANSPPLSFRWILLPGAPGIHARIGSSTAKPRDTSAGASRCAEKPSGAAAACSDDGGEGFEATNDAFEPTIEAGDPDSQRARRRQRSEQHQFRAAVAAGALARQDRHQARGSAGQRSDHSAQGFDQQGTTTLRDAITNASGVNQGGQDSLGYFDHFLIRGLNAQVYSDGFSDGDLLGGISRIH